MAAMYTLLDLFLANNEDDSAVTAVINNNRSSTKLMTFFTLLLVSKRGKRRRKARIANYVETIMPLYQIDDFRQRFRMNRDTFNELTETLSPILIHGDCDGSMKIPVDKQLLIYIKYVSSQQTMQTIGDLFGVCEATICNLVRRKSSVICDELMQEMIKWPGARQIRQNVIDFQTLKGFPGIVGAIDGNHIPIRPPRKLRKQEELSLYYPPSSM